MYQHLRIQLILLPNWAYLHRASLELRDQRLRVEGVIRQQVRGGLGEMPEDEHDAHGRVLVKTKNSEICVKRLRVLILASTFLSRSGNALKQEFIHIRGLPRVLDRQADHAPFIIQININILIDLPRFHRRMR